MVVIYGITAVVLYLTSTLNPFLHCWKIRAVRQAVKQTNQISILLSMELYFYFPELELRVLHDVWELMV